MKKVTFKCKQLVICNILHFASNLAKLIFSSITTGTYMKSLKTIFSKLSSAMTNYNYEDQSTTETGKTKVPIADLGKKMMPFKTSSQMLIKL